MRKLHVFVSELRCAALVQLSDAVSFLVSQQMSPPNAATPTPNICWVRLVPFRPNYTSDRR